MSNSVLTTNEFFSDKDISEAEKVSVIALLDGGTYNVMVGQGGAKNFVSSVNKRGKNPIMVMNEYGNKNSLNPMACEATLHALALGINLSDFSTMSDQEICSKIASAYKLETGLSDQGLESRYSGAIEPRLKMHLKEANVHNQAITPDIISNLSECAKTAFGAKKKELNQ